jgi:hypothetical protein
MQMVGYQQIVLLGGGAFAEEMMSKGAAVDLEAFPSIKASLYTVFHKFYVDRSRKLLQSDAFDIIISSAAPYVDTIFTENHQAEVLRKTQKLDNFVQNLSIYTVSDLRGLPPATSQGPVPCHPLGMMYALSPGRMLQRQTRTPNAGVTPAVEVSERNARVLRRFRVRRLSAVPAAAVGQHRGPHDAGVGLPAAAQAPAAP